MCWHVYREQRVLRALYTGHKLFAARTRDASDTLPLRQRERRYVDRGIIPRALSLIFAEFKERSDQQFTCHISYLEIYNEQVCLPCLVC